MSFAKILGEGLTYDDVLLAPRYSDFHPRETDLSTQFTRNIRLNIPLVSAAMDTVTEAAMAMALAREGGIGIIHKNMSIEQQAEQIQRVKRSESGMILDPITLGLLSRVADALALMKRYSISGVPIVDENGKLVGIVTNRDLRFQPDMDQPISEVMTSSNLITAPVGTTLSEAELILQKHGIEKLPVVDEAGVLNGLITFKDIRKKRQFPNASKDMHGRLRVGRQAPDALGFFGLESAEALAEIVAQNWETLNAGPEPEREAQALAVEREFAREHGLRLLALCRECVAG